MPDADQVPESFRGLGTEMNDLKMAIGLHCDHLDLGTVSGLLRLKQLNAEYDQANEQCHAALTHYHELISKKTNPYPIKWVGCRRLYSRSESRIGNTRVEV